MNDQYLLRSTAVAARKLGGEMMVMSAIDAGLFSLNPIATAIWEAADGVTPLREIVERKICPDYDVEPEIALADARSLVDELSKRGILVVSDQPMAARA
jgi:hypothetical protein